MKNQVSFRNLFIGKDVIASRAEFKRLMLTGYLAIICMVVCAIYTFLDLSNGIYHALVSYAILFLVSVISLFLLRKKRYKPAKVLLMLASNLVVFWAALNDPFETGTFLLFIPTGIGSFAMLGFEDMKTGIALAGLSAILFILAFFVDLKPSGIQDMTKEYIRTSFILNYFISLTISVLVVYFQMNLNKHSESELILKEDFANQKNTELQKVNDELDRFVYSVSHDLRSPLSSILGLTNIARLTTNRAELDEILKMIQGRVNAQDHYIREIIDYARNARTETIAESVPLKILLDEVVDSLKFNQNADRIEFRKNIPEHVVLNSDKIRLTVILSNLIGNAIKYQDLRKHSPYIEVGYNTDRSELYVQDNGIGIMPEHREKIFHMFYRGSDRSTGSGLGLFITKEAALKIGGRVEVSSIYGEGSRFVVYLQHS